MKNIFGTYQTLKNFFSEISQIHEILHKIQVPSFDVSSTN